MDNSKPRSKYGVFILIAIISLLAIGVFYLISTKKLPSLKTLQQQSGNQGSTPSVSREGVFTSFTATAQGVVTRLDNSSIEIEAGSEKRTFKLSTSVFVAKDTDNLFNKIVGLLIPEAFAQSPSTPSAATSNINPSVIPPPPSTSSSAAQAMNVKTISDVKVGQTVTINLTKMREKDEWEVTTIFIQPQ